MLPKCCRIVDAFGMPSFKPSGHRAGLRDAYFAPIARSRRAARRDLRPHRSIVQAAARSVAVAPRKVDCSPIVAAGVFSVMAAAALPLRIAVGSLRDELTFTESRLLVADDERIAALTKDFKPLLAR
jgi:hypothetical protein